MRRSNSQSNVQSEAPPANQLSQMGPPVMSAGGKINGLNFDHVLHKLQVSGTHNNADASLSSRRVERPVPSYKA
jgi:hypothetical protein